MDRRKIKKKKKAGTWMRFGETLGPPVLAYLKNITCFLFLL